MKKLFISLSIFALGACGGGSGSGSGSSADLVTIDSQNAPEIAAAVATSTVNSDLPDGSELLFGITGSASKPSAPDMAAFSKTLANQVLSAPVAGTSGDFQFDCEIAGSISISATVSNQSTLSAGDRITFSFNNCSNSVNEIADGTIRMTIRSFSGDVTTGENVSMSISTEFIDYNIIEGDGEVFGFDGDMTISLNATDPMNVVSSLSSNRLTVVENGRNQSIEDYNVEFSVDETTGAYTITTSGTFIDNANLGGAVTFRTLAPFEGTGDEDPQSGQMEITGADGGIIIITVQGANSVLIEIDIEGDGVIDGTIETTWDEMEDLLDD